MKLFRRPAGIPSSAPDAAFPYWSGDQAQRFLALVRAALAEAGVEATVYAEQAEDASGRTFGLGNLAAACHNDDRGERAWRKIVEGHVRTVVSGLNEQSPFKTMPPADILAATYLRLMPAEDVLPNMSYARPVRDGACRRTNASGPVSSSSVRARPTRE